MPSRVIRGDINESESLATVSIEAELAFRALLMAADDFGRMDARPRKLKAALFPMRDEATPQRIVAWLKELAGIPDPPIRFYSVDGREFLECVNWEAHRSKARRGAQSKYPDPPPMSKASGQVALPGFRGDPRGSAENSGDPRGSAETGREGAVEGVRGDPRKSHAFRGDPPEGYGSEGYGSEGYGDAGAFGATAPPPSGTASPVPLPSAVWPSVVNAFGLYADKHPDARVPDLRRGLNDARARAIGRVIREHGRDGPVKAVHGYVAMHSDRWADQVRNHAPETVFAASKVAKYIERAGSPESWPHSIDQPKSGRMGSWQN
ncbi:MAG: hypothetical protein AAF517_12835 [Planctomycetota bacterium]